MFWRDAVDELQAAVLALRQAHHGLDTAPIEEIVARMRERVELDAANAPAEQEVSEASAPPAGSTS